MKKIQFDSLFAKNINTEIVVKKDGSFFVQPSTSKEYCDRSNNFVYKIDKEDLAYNLFISHGFTWGGEWKSLKDYCHFEKEINQL